MNMKKEYSSPIAECKAIDTWDIITTSKLKLASYGEETIDEISIDSLIN